MIITEDQKKLLLENLPEAESLIESTEINDLLSALDDRITEIGFNEDYSLNSIGIKLQKAYDQIFEQNK